MASAGPLSPAVGSAYASGGENIAGWVNIVSSNNIYSTCELRENDISNTWGAKDFGFAIPNDAIVDGILFEAECYARVTIGAELYDVWLYDGAELGSAVISSTVFPASESETYLPVGGASETFGASLTGVDVNSATFEMRFRCRSVTGGGASSEANIDHVRVTVYYTLANTAPTITVAPTVSYTSGSQLTQANSPATVTFTATDAEETGAGELSYTIRTAASGGGTLVGSGTCTSGASKQHNIAIDDAGLVEGAQTLYLQVSDGTLTDEESFSLSVTFDQSITCAHLASTTTLYGATLTPGTADITAAHLSSTAQTYGATLTAGTASLSAAHLASTAQSYGATLNVENGILAAHLPSGATLYGATLTGSDQTINAGTIPSASEVFAASIQPGAAQIESALLAAQTALYGAQVLPGTVTLDADHLGATSALYGAALVAGAVEIDAGFIALASMLYPATIIYDQALLAAAITSGSVLYGPLGLSIPVPLFTRLRDRTKHYKLKGQ